VRQGGYAPFRIKILTRRAAFLLLFEHDLLLFEHEFFMAVWLWEMLHHTQHLNTVFCQ